MREYKDMGKTYKIGDFITVEELDDENNSNKEVSLKEDNNKDIIIDSSKFKGKELKYYQNNLQGKIVHHPVLGDIHLGKKGRKETLFRCRGQYLAVLCFIDKIIETGYSNGQPEDLEHSRNDDIYQFFRIYNTVIFNGKLLGVNVLIGEDFQGKKYYMFKTEDYSLDEKIEINPSLNRKEANRPKPSQEAYNLIIKNKNKNVKSIVTKSKDIKNSITEQIAYHGSYSDFNTFDMDKIQRYDYGYGIYFTMDFNYAKNYGNIKKYEIPDDEYLLSWEDIWQRQSDYVYECLDKLFDYLYDNDKDNWEKIMEIVDRGYANDGGCLYNNLSEILKLTPKQTSELLYKYGIKGIYSFKGDCFVIFNPEDIKIKEIKEDMKNLNIFKKLNEELKPLLEENITINTEQTSDPIILDIAFEDKYGNGKGRYISGLHVGDRLTVRMKGLSNFDVKGFKIIEIDDKKAKLLHPKYTEEDGNTGRVYIIDLNNVEINMGEEIRFRPLDKIVDSWFAVLHVHRKDIDKLIADK